MSGRGLFVPFFLAPLDRYLRNNHPAVWRTRAHVLLLYSVIPLNILCYLLARWREVDLENIPTSANLLFYTSSLLLAVFFLFVWWAGDQRRVPLPRRGWRTYVVTVGLYWLCLLSFGWNILIYTIPVIQRTAGLAPREDIERAYRIAQQWEYCQGCDCEDTVYNRATPADLAFMQELAGRMGYDVLKEEVCDYADSNRVYLQVREGYTNRARRFNRQIESLYEASAFNRREGAYFHLYRWWFPLLFFLLGGLGAHWLYFGSLRGVRPRRERTEFFTRRDLFDLWIIGWLDQYLLRNHPWWWNVQLHRWLFYVLFWGNAVLLMFAYSLPLCLGHIVDDLVLFALVLLVWLLGGIGWFIGWTYQRSLQAVVRKEPGRNLLLVAGYVLAFYAIIFNAGVFSYALAHRLDRLLTNEQLLHDMRYRLDNRSFSPDLDSRWYRAGVLDYAALFGYRNGEVEYYYGVEDSYAYVWTRRILHLRERAEKAFASMGNSAVDSIDQILLPYANQLIPLGRLEAIPVLPPEDTNLNQRLRALQDTLDVLTLTPQHLVDSLLAERRRPVLEELRQLQNIGGTDEKEAVALGQACLDWRQAQLSGWLEQVRGDLAQTHTAISMIDEELLRRQSQLEQDSLPESEALRGRQLLDTMYVWRRQYLFSLNLPDLPPGIGFDAFVTYSSEYDSLTRLIEPLERARQAVGYPSLSLPARRNLIEYRKSFLRDRLEEIDRNRYAAEQELRSERTAPVEGERQWLSGLAESRDYFNHSLFLFIDRYQENALSSLFEPADIIAEIERQAAELAVLNTQDLDPSFIEMPMDACHELENWERRQEVEAETLPDSLVIQTIASLDFSCRYQINKEGVLPRLVERGAHRLFDIDFVFRYPSKLAPAWAAVLEAKNFRNGQGIAYNLLTLYLPLYALPFALTYIFLSLAFFYFSPASVGATAGGTLTFFVVLSLLPSQGILQDPLWAYLLAGLVVVWYAFFAQGAQRFTAHLALAWFLCSPLFLAVVLMDRWGDVLKQRMEVDIFTLATEPVLLLWLIWAAYLFVNLTVASLATKAFAKHAYLPQRD